MRVLKLCPLRFGEVIGITSEQIQALTFYERSNLFDEQQKPDPFCGSGDNACATTLREANLDAIRKYFSEEQIVELLLVICARTLRIA